ncbi:MAG TPA: hypothetical protein PLL20_17875 [Phycisphaerae bacterium]|nr:hypothetical protein [Phycisphaerae bacterium]HRR84997.1 hypothetical protein [Phycisphaerae bacterium]
MKRSCAIAVVPAVLMSCSSAMAGRCIGVEPRRIIMCDDFDSYCNGGDPWPGYPPSDPPPAACVDGSSVNSVGFLTNWAEMTMLCGFDMKIGSDQKYSMPFGMKYPAGIEDYVDVEEEQRVYDLLRQGAIEMAAVRRGEPAADAVNGTADAPLVLYFVLWLGHEGNRFGQYKDLYVELALGGDRAPTDHVMSEDCSQMSCGGPSKGFPVVCQVANPLEPRPADCPPISTATHAAIAFGLLSKLDMNPCHPELCGTGAHHPQNNHPAFFDGNRWWVVKGGYGGANGDFSLTKAYHRFSMTVTDTQVELRMWAPGATISPYRATYPRQYTGPFDRVRIGVGRGCVLDDMTGTCAAPISYDCINGSHSGNPWVDDVVLYDGVLTRSQGSQGGCCVPLDGCRLMTAGDCAAAGGTYRGDGTNCDDARACCPTPFADIDEDGDVDQTDFSFFQACYTGPGAFALDGICKCFDVTDSAGSGLDSAVDGNDLARFERCGSGPGVPLVPACN